MRPAGTAWILQGVEVVLAVYALALVSLTVLGVWGAFVLPAEEEL